MSRSSMFARFGIVMAAAWLVVPQSASAATTYFYCVVQDYHGRETRYVSDIRQTDVEKLDTTMTGFAYSDEIESEWYRDYPGQGSRKSYCSKSTNLAYLEKERAELLGDSPAARQIAFTKAPVASKPADRSGLILSGSPFSQPSGAKTETQPKAPAATADQPEVAASESREQREAEWQAKVAAHQAKVADYNRKVAEREAEIARQEKQQAEARDAAAREKAAYEAKMAAHRRELDAANRRQQEYFAAQRRHALCVNGDQKACAEIALGEPAMGDELAANDQPKTSDDDARTCVSRPVVSASSTFKGQTQAVVFNGCKTAVDVRICLLRSGGWNCGVAWGLKPQERWTHTSFETRGELFWDARMAGSNQSLASPGGN